MAYIKLELFHESSNTTVTRQFDLVDSDIIRFTDYLQDKFATITGAAPEPLVRTPASVDDATTGEFNALIGRWTNEVLSFEREREIANISIPTFG
jgi:hypothetical protein